MSWIDWIPVVFLMLAELAACWIDWIPVVFLMLAEMAAFGGLAYAAYSWQKTDKIE